MKFNTENLDIYVPDGTPPEAALARTTHLGVSAHQDDLELMAVDGILRCFQQESLWFTGVVVTNGAGSPRSGVYEKYSDDEMMAVRRREQNKAALVGEYAAQVQLGYTSAAVKDNTSRSVVEDLAEVFRAACPQIIYTHNLVDRHPTHVATAVRVIQALRSLPAAGRPKKVYGCEIWRSLDWLQDEDKVVFDCSGMQSLQNALLGVFDSQISGGKRYDLAAMGRRAANATYHASHAVDTATGLAYAMDLTPLADDPQADIQAYVRSTIERFSCEVDNLVGSFNQTAP